MQRSQLLLAGMVLLGGCASVPPPAPVSLINSLSFDNPMTGMRDGLRSAWPLARLSQTRETFPLAQVRQCDPTGVCSWGVLSAQRQFGSVRRIAGGVALMLDLNVDVDRSQQRSGPEQYGAMTIPSDVGALHATRRVRREVVLPFGTIERIDLDYGIRFELCAMRLDDAGQPIDACAIPYF